MNKTPDDMTKVIMEFSSVLQKRAKCESEHGVHDSAACVVCKWRNTMDPQEKHRIVDSAYQNNDDAAVREMIMMGADIQHIRPRKSKGTSVRHEFISDANFDLINAALLVNERMWASEVFPAIANIKQGWLVQLQVAQMIKSSPNWRTYHEHGASCRNVLSLYTEKGIYPIVFLYLVECKETNCIWHDPRCIYDDFCSFRGLETIPDYMVSTWDSIMKDVDYYTKRNRPGIVFSLLCGYTHCPASPFHKDRLPRDLFKPILHLAYLFVFEGELASQTTAVTRE